MNYSNKALGSEFEKEIKNLLTKLDFNDVDGARDNFLVNGIQVDVCGGFGNALLVIECKTKQKPGEKNLRNIINEFRGKIPVIEKGFREHKYNSENDYSKYNFFKYILVTRNIKPRKEDYRLANTYPYSIYIWDDDFLKYYSDLYEFIKPYAKYNLLGEMNIKPIKESSISIPAIQTKFANYKIYSFIMNPRDLLEVAYVARRERKDERYYQRAIDKKRLKKITEYIENGGIFPNNIIIAFDTELKVKFHEKNPSNIDEWPYLGIKYGILEFPREYRSCWIIDGQHRLYSFVNLKEDLSFNMPIVAFDGIDLISQRKFFLDINKNQKAVDPDLLWDLSGDVPNETEGIISNVVKKLNMDINSKLYHLIYYPSTGISSKRGKIKISAVCTAIKKIKIVTNNTQQSIKNPLYNLDYKILINNVSKSLEEYFDVLYDEFKDNWTLKEKGFILSNGGLPVMLYLYEKIVSRVMLKNNGKPSYDDFKFYLEPLKEILISTDNKIFGTLRLKCTSEGGRSDTLTDFILKIRESTSDNYFGGEIEKREFRELDKKLKELIKYKLYDSNNDEWLKKFLSQDDYKKVIGYMEKNRVNDKKLAYLHLTLGQCIDLMRRQKSVFYPIFINNNQDFSFREESDLEYAFTFITRMRNTSNAHYTGIKIKSDDEKQLELFLGKINSCIDYGLT